MPGPESLDAGLTPPSVILPGTTSGPGNIANPTGAPIISPGADERLPGTTAGPGNIAVPDTLSESSAPRGGE